MADWLTLDDYKAWARIADTDTVDDAAIQANIDAVDSKFRLLSMCGSPVSASP